jgi:hypothetical protein
MIIDVDGFLDDCMKDKVFETFFMIIYNRKKNNDQSYQT